MSRRILIAATLLTTTLGMPADSMTPLQERVLLLGSNSAPFFNVDLNFSTGNFCIQGYGCLPASTVIASTHSNTAWAQWADGHWSTFAATMSPITDLGLLVQQGTTNELLQSRTPATTWTASNVTVANGNQIGIDNVANSAGTITASAANGTLCQPRTITSSVQSLQFELQRLVGTGEIDISINGGSTWVNVTTQIANAAASSWKWARVTIENQTLANPSACVRIVTNGDSVAFDQAQLEALPTVTTPITTTTTTQSRSNDIPRINDPYKSLIEAHYNNLSVFFENNNRIHATATPNWLYMSAGTAPTTNNTVLKPDGSGGIEFIITQSNGQSQTQHVATNILNEEIQRSAFTIAVNNQAFVTTAGSGSNATGGYYVPQAFLSTLTTLPALPGGDIVIGGTTTGGSQANDYVRRVAFSFGALPYSTLQNWINGQSIGNVATSDPIIDNKNLYLSTLTSGSSTFPPIGVNAHTSTTVNVKPIPVANNLAMSQAVGAKWVRLGETWSNIEQVKATCTGSLSGNTVTFSAGCTGVAIGQMIADAAGGVTPGTAITAGSGLSWTFGGTAQSVASRALNMTVYDTSAIDPMVTAYVGAGIKINWVLGIGTTLYGMVSNAAMPTTTFQSNALANLAVYIANHYTTSITAMEIENEPNLGASPVLTAAQFAAMYNIVAAAVHSAQSGMQIISGGLGTPASAGNDPNTYIAAFEGARTAFISGVGNHPYNNGAEGNPEQMVAQTASFAAAAGVPASQVYLTEQGYTLPWTAGDNQRKFGWTARSTLSQFVAQPALWEWYDQSNDGTDPTDLQSNFGLFDYNYNPLQAATGYSAITALAAAATSFDVIQSSTWVYQVNFHLSSGVTSSVVWNYHMPAYNIQHTITVSSTAGLSVKDLYGNNVAYQLNGNNVTVLLTEYVGPLVISSGGITPCTSTGVFDLSNVCNDIYLIGSLK